MGVLRPWRLGQWATCLLLAAMCLFLSGVARGQNRPARRGTPPADRPKMSGPAIKVGEPAPDFELPLLKEETAEDGTKSYRITDEKVKLSSFRGKKVVCVFMSSYT